MSMLIAPPRVGRLEVVGVRNAGPREQRTRSTTSPTR
ncbi:hypothetical protein ABIC64_000563 [Plantibacter flavus]